jgi:hypothetical protein
MAVGKRPRYRRLAQDLSLMAPPSFSFGISLRQHPAELFEERDLEFESVFLQRRVRKLSVPSAIMVEGRHFVFLRCASGLPNRIVSHINHVQPISGSPLGRVAQHDRAPISGPCTLTYPTKEPPL